jgi:hypothetical protein
VKLNRTIHFIEREVAHMLIWKGEQQAVTGTYWDISTGDRISIKDQETLPGDYSKTYIKASSAVVLLFGPVVGLSFAIFLPFIGIAMAVSFVGKKIVSAGKTAAQRVANSAVKNIFFAWKPLQAYLAGRQKGKERTEI